MSLIVPNINSIKLAECTLRLLQSFKCLVLNYYVRCSLCVDLNTVYIPYLPVFANLKLVPVTDEPDKKVKYSMHCLKRYSRLTILEKKHNTKKYSIKTVNCWLTCFLYVSTWDLRELAFRRSCKKWYILLDKTCCALRHYSGYFSECWASGLVQLVKS